MVANRPLGTGSLAAAAMSWRDMASCGDGCKVEPTAGALVPVPALGLPGLVVEPLVVASACRETNMPIEPIFFFAVGIILSRMERGNDAIQIVRFRGGRRLWRIVYLFTKVEERRMETGWKDMRARKKVCCVVAACVGGGKDSTGLIESRYIDVLKGVGFVLLIRRDESLG